MHNNISLQQVTVGDLKDLISGVVREQLEYLKPSFSADQTKRSGLLTRDEAARFLRVSIATLHRRVKAGDIPTIGMKGRTLFRQRDLEAFIDAQSSCADGRAQ